MAHQVIWTRRVYEFFCDAANLTKLDRDILSQRIAGMTIKEMQFYYDLSESAINKRIARLKRIYDEVQKEYPEELKPRRTSAAETYMDVH